MNKFLISLCFIFVGSIGLKAQYQLSNPGFDGEWVDCTPWIGSSSSRTQGTTPVGWCVANVIGTNSGTGATTVGQPDTDRQNGSNSYSCKLENKGVTFSSQVIPGYVSLGTTWNTAKGITANNADGGSWGGVAFTGTPDAMEFYYKRTASDNSQPASVVVYMWKGHTTQYNVPVGVVLTGNVPTYEMINRDRNILGMEYSQPTGDENKPKYSDDFSLIASLMTGNEHIIKLTEEKSSWTLETCEFTYHNEVDKPEMINVIFSAMDYFTERTNHKKGNTLTVDDVKFLYYSELASGSFDGEALVINEDGTIDDVNAIYSEENISLTSNGHGASIEKTYDEESAQLTITVKGEDISENEDNFHTYTIQFAKPGDVNGDKQVTIADVTALVNIILGKGESSKVADINGDGNVTIADVTALVNIILGK